MCRHSSTPRRNETKETEHIVLLDHTDYHRGHVARSAAIRILCIGNRYGSTRGALYHRDQADADERMPILELEPRHRRQLHRQLFVLHAHQSVRVD